MKTISIRDFRRHRPMAEVAVLVDREFLIARACSGGSSQMMDHNLKPRSHQGLKSLFRRFDHLHHRLCPKKSSML